MVLEGGYSLEALEVSSEAVIRTLQLNPRDSDGFNDLLRGYGIKEELCTYEKLAFESLQNPRYSFRLTMSALSKLIKKQWGHLVEHLIFEKPRHKSSTGQNILRKTKTTGEDETSESDSL